jgi:putative membrane protein
MKKAILLTTALSVAGLAGVSAAQTTSAGSRGQQEAPAAGVLGKQDMDFFEDAAQGGLQEVKLGELAVKQTASEDVRKFGQRMIDDHNKLNARLTEIGHDKKGLAVPTELDKKHRSAVDKLASLTGAKFDREYMSRMVDDHQNDVKAFEKEAKEGKDPDLKQFAATSLPTLLDHLNQAKEIEARVKK